MGHGRADARRLRSHALTCRPRRHFDHLLQTATADHIECRQQYWRCARLAVDMHREGGGRGSPSTNAMAMAGPGGFGVSLGALPGRLGHRGCAVCSGGGVPRLQLECHIGGQILTRSPTVNELTTTCTSRAEGRATSHPRHRIPHLHSRFPRQGASTPGASTLTAIST